MQILETLSYATMDMFDLITAFLAAGYGASSKKIEYQMYKQQSERSRRKYAEEQQRKKKLLEKQTQQRFYNILYKLEKDGLVKKAVKNKKSFFSLTQKGKEKIKNLKARKTNPLRNHSYEKIKGERFAIVIFDVPEVERKKREWLRAVLKNLGFKLIQRSVFLGKIQIPERFLHDLKKLNIVNYVEIFEITKIGAIEYIL